MKGFKFISRALLLVAIIYVLSIAVEACNQTMGFYDATKIEIFAEAPLHKDKVKIYAIEEREIYDSIPPFVLGTALYDSVRTRNFPFSEGDNQFVVLYDDRYYYPFTQFKYNESGQDEFTVRLWWKEKEIEIEVDIGGASFDFFSGTMLPIDWDMYGDSTAVSPSSDSTDASPL